MPITESLYFMYDGIRSDEMGIINVNLSPGMQEETFLPEQTISEVSIPGRDTPYFMGLERRPITIPLNFAFTDHFDHGKLEAVAKWLGNQPYYKPLYFSDNIDKWYYALYTGEAKLLHNSLKQGYVSIQMRNISPCTYSPTYETSVYDLSVNDSMTGTNVLFTNEGSLPCKPIIYIEKIGPGEISIINNSDRGATFRIVNLVDNERLTVDCEHEDIVTDLPLTHRFDDAYGDFPSFVYGDNVITIMGNCKIYWKYRFSNYG